MKIFLYLSIFLLFFQFSYSQKNGPYEKNYDNGQLKITGQFKNKKRVGEWKEYYETGELHKTYSYTKGKRDAERKAFYKNGTLKSETKKVGENIFSYQYFESGKPFVERILYNGYYKEYFESGVLKVESNYVEGDLSGVWMRFFETGEKEWEVTYLNGYKHGIYNQYHLNGKLKTTGEHILDKKEGKQQRFNENGELVWEGSLSKGVFNKKWKRYSSGTVSETLKFKNGNLTGSNATDLISVDVPNGNIEQVPVYPGCESVLGNKGQKKCLNKKIAEFVFKNFNTELANDLGLSGRQKIYVMFKIDKSGQVIDTRSRAVNAQLEKEAIRVISKLPKMTPGYQRGKAVIVPYSLPIVFQIQAKKKNNKSGDFVRDY